jgi:hypothetical protein
MQEPVAKNQAFGPAMNLDWPQPLSKLPRGRRAVFVSTKVSPNSN